MSVGIRHDDVRRRNRAMVLGAIRRSGSPSRTEIAAVTALSHSTISAISADLIAEGILREAANAEPAHLKRGRPQVGLEANPGAGAIAVVILSLNSLAAALVDYSGQVMAHEQRRIATRTLPASELVGETVAMLRRVIATQTGTAAVLRVAMAVQGVTDKDGRALLWSPITPHTDIPFAEILEEACGVPTAVENDCGMMAEALGWRDPGLYRDNFMAVLLSHGIGMGLVLKGEMFTGTQSSGGEFGHMIHRPEGALCRCGRRGCVEAYAGNYAIWRFACGLPDDAPPADDVPDEAIIDLAHAARRGEPLPLEAFRRAGEALGYGLGSLFALIDPAPACFVGVGATAYDLMEPTLRAALARTAGGHHAEAIAFAAEPSEMPLILEGCTMRALTFIDEMVFAPGTPAAGRDVA
ncbi:MAG: ROK family transcriptional regulator [Rhizobiaceae bacterium]|nr:ROK family transcriptional regulator [Rhizobiaceae bacterium]